MQKSMDLWGAILCGMWAIWTASNKRSHGEASMSITQACRWASDMASDLVQTSYNWNGKVDKSTVIKWRPPPTGFVKENVDASFNSDTLQGATGVFIRDDQGKIISVSSRWYENLPNVITAEAYACRDGAEMMHNLNLAKVIMETNRLELIASWKNMNGNRSCIIPVLYQIEELSSSCVLYLNLIM